MSLCSLYKVLLTISQLDLVTAMPVGVVEFIYSHIVLLFNLFFGKGSKNNANGKKKRCYNLPITHNLLLLSVAVLAETAFFTE